MATRRELGFVETMAAISHANVRGGAQITATARISGPLQPDVLRSGLDALRAQHPLLRATIQHTAQHAAPTYWFVVDEPGPAIDLSVIEKDDAAQWKDVAEREMASPIDAGTRLWRAVLLRDPHEVAPQHDLLLSFHHAIADGIGIAYVIRDLLRYCNAAATGETIDRGARPLLAAVEARLRQQRTTAEYDELVRTMLARQPALTPWPVSAPAPMSKRLSRIASRELGPTTVEELVQRARREGTTVNAALAAAMLIAGARARGIALTASMVTAVSIRRYCEPVVDEDELGCFISTVRTAHEEVAGNSELWQLARAYRDQLLAHVPIEAFRPVAPDRSMLSTLFDADAASRQTELPRHFGLTNVGALDIADDQGPYRLRAFRLCTAQHAGIYVGFLHVTTVGGTMYLDLAYPDPLVPGAWAEAFMDQVARLVSAC